MLKNGSDFHVNEHQKIRHYRNRSTEESEERRMPNLDFFTSRGAYENCIIIHSFNWKSAVEYDGGV